MKRNTVRTVAVGGVTTLALLAAAPGWAATVVAQSTAAALEVAIGGNGADSGRVSATASDDQTSTKEGQVNPPVDVVDNQLLLNIGVLAQDAVADVVNRNGLSAAFSGIAGEGGAVAEVGDSDCLTPGRPIDVSIANLDLTGTQLADERGALAPLNELGDPVVQQVVGPVTAAISDGLSQLGTLGLGGTLGAVQARCTAAPGTAQGTATLVDSQLTADVDGTEVVLLDFPAEPAPNTEVVTDLDEVVNLLLEGLRTDLTNSLDGLAAPLAGLIDPVQDNLVDTVVAQVAQELKPLEDTVLRATFNKQTSSGPGQISVTALDLAVLPAAAESPLAAPLVEAIIANVTCGPNAQVGAGDPTNPGGPGGGDGGDGPGDGGPGDGPGDGGPGDGGGAGGALPEVPTVIDAGTAADGGLLGTDAAMLAAGALALAGAAGVAGHRRLARR